MMKAALRYLGTAGALIFIGIILSRHASEMPALNFASAHTWMMLVGACGLYVVAQLIGAVAWRATLDVHDVELPRARAESQLLVSQIGKYIPGNVAHLVGRFALARVDGLPSAVVVSSLLLEAGLLVSSAALVVGVLLLIMPEFIGEIMTSLPDVWTNGLAVALILGLLTSIGALLFVIWRKSGRPNGFIPKCVVPMLLQVTNFVVLGASLLCAAHAVHGSENLSLMHCTAIFATAWVAGFLVPGAPGGVGIRDGIIVLGLGLFIGQGAGLAAAALHRIMSILGDGIAFGIGQMLRQRQNEIPQQSV